MGRRNLTRIDQVQAGDVIVIHSDNDGDFRGLKLEGFAQFVLQTAIDQGVIGDSAFQIWQSLGNEGNEEDFLNSLRGTGTDDADRELLDRNFPQTGSTVAAGAFFIRDGLSYRNNTGVEWTVPETWPATPVANIDIITGQANLDLLDPAIRKRFTDFVLQFWTVNETPSGEAIAVFADGCDPITGDPTFTLCPVAFELTLNQSTITNILIETSDGSPYSVDWGDGNVSEDVVSGQFAVHTYAAPYTGNVSISTTIGSDVERIFTNNGQWEFDVIRIPRTCLDMSFGNNAKITGNWRDLPPEAIRVVIGGQSTAGGNTIDIPRTVEEFFATGSTVTVGDIKDPVSYTHLTLPTIYSV